MLRAPRAKLKAEIFKLPRKPTVKQQLEVAWMCAHLGKQVKDILEAETVFLPALEEGDLVAFQAEEVIDTPVDKAVEPEDPDVDGTVDGDNKFGGQDEAEVSLILPEKLCFLFPQTSFQWSSESHLNL